MALSGAPSSPSIVGVLVSTAQRYGKVVHYEAATERILTCDDSGRSTLPTEQSIDWNSGSPLLIQTGILNALEAGVQSIGVTNLCTPQMTRFIFDSFSSNAKQAPQTPSVMTALPFQPTAVIFVPYRAYYAWKHVVSGIACDIPDIPCWHESLADTTFFGRASSKQSSGSCPVDVGQDALIQLWDELRTRHTHVSIIGDPKQLTADLLQSSRERVLLKFPCLMDGLTWTFYGGSKLKADFEAVTTGFPFHEHPVDLLDGTSCPSIS